MIWSVFILIKKQPEDFTFCFVCVCKKVLFFCLPLICLYLVKGCCSCVWGSGVLWRSRLHWRYWPAKDTKRYPGNILYTLYTYTIFYQNFWNTRTQHKLQKARQFCHEVFICLLVSCQWKWKKQRLASWFSVCKRRTDNRLSQRDRYPKRMWSDFTDSCELALFVKSEGMRGETWYGGIWMTS